MATAAKAKSGLAGLLNAAGKKTPGANKSSMPTCTLPIPIAPLVKVWSDAKRAEETAIAQRKSAEEKLRPVASDLRLNVCRKQGKVHASVLLDGGEHGSVKFIQQGRFTNMPQDLAEDPLTAAFGNDYDRYFRTRPQIEISDDLTDGQATALAKALQKIFGDDIEKFVTVKPIIVPTDLFITDVTLNQTVSDKAKALQNEGLCVPYAASFRL